MPLQCVYDKLWTGSADACNKKNLLGHGIKYAVLLDGVTLPADVPAVIERLTTNIKGSDEKVAPETLVGLVETVLHQVAHGKRVVFVDATGEGPSCLMVVLYLSMLGFAWDEAWARMLFLNKKLKPPPALFGVARHTARLTFAVLKP